MKIIEFNVRITKIKEKHKILWEENYENHEIHKIPFEIYENVWSLKIPGENYENHGNS